MDRHPEIVFPFIGGAHHVHHLAPVAAELAHLMPEAKVACLYTGDETEAALRVVAPGLHVEPVALPRWGQALAALSGRSRWLKKPLLFSLRDRLRGAAIVTPERTSATLRAMGLRDELMIHFHHGAGDRALASDAKLKAFDLIVVPGDKDVRRTVEAAHMPSDRVACGGYVKLELLRNGPPAQRPFADNRPTVLYNPHFDTSLSSWPMAAGIIAAFAAQDRYNLVVAPHLRVAEDMMPAEMARWQALAVPGRIIVDLASPKLVDMSYTRGCDIYLGDVSSQLYEFIAEPRPAVFIDVRGIDWTADPHFACWHLGQVARGPSDVIAAIDLAVAGHAAVADRQSAAVRQSFGEIDGAARRGAEIIVEALSRRAA